MSALRILHVVPYYEQAWAYGGIPRLTVTMTRTLARRGHLVTVCTTDACDDASRADASPIDASFIEGLSVRVFRNASNYAAYHWQLFTPIGFSAYLRSALDNDSFDVAHLHACHNLLTAVAARLLSRYRVPYIVMPNGTAVPIERRIVAKRLFASTVGRHVLSNAARVLAVSESERRSLEALGVPDHRIVTVPNPVDTDGLTSPPSAARFRRTHGLGDAPIVLFLGKLTPRKGVDDLIRAFARLSRAEPTLVIAGNDMGAGRTVDALISRLPHGRRVVRTGLLRGIERLDALAAADVAIYPSRDEVFGLVPLESLLCGSPVIVCDDSGCGEIVNRVGGGVVVPPGNERALTAAIEGVLDAKDLWRQRARIAGLQVRTLFSADVVCDRLEQLYSEVVAGPDAQRRMTA